jgi:hypothetical protein
LESGQGHRAEDKRSSAPMPREFGQLTNLRELHLEGNPLAAPLPGLIAQGIPALLAFLQSLPVPSGPTSGDTT